MKIILLKDVLENGVVKTTHRPRKKWVIGWYADTVIDVSETTAAKLISSGIARACTDTTEEDSQ